MNALPTGARCRQPGERIEAGDYVLFNFHDRLTVDFQLVFITVLPTDVGVGQPVLDDEHFEDYPVWTTRPAIGCVEAIAS